MPIFAWKPVENNRTALGRWNNALTEQLQEGISLIITNVNAIGPFDNTGFSGLLRTYEVETNLDMNKAYEGRDGPVNWVNMPHYSGIERAKTWIYKQMS